ncbi:hypothetical protein RA290_08470 [Pantoea agglomerans]|uniref:hypothetical protein n=1 Tax=Enterobacter agglomerans TaxID=549 RepID=UPI003AAD9624
MSNFIQQFKYLNKIKFILGGYTSKGLKKKVGRNKALSRLESELGSLSEKEQISFAEQCQKNIAMRQLLNLHSFDNDYFIDRFSEKDSPIVFIIFSFLYYYKDNLKRFEYFEDLKLSLESKIVSGKYDEAYRTIELIKVNFGNSIWLCDSLMSLHKLSKKEVEKKDFVINSGSRLFHITNHIYEKHTSVSALSYTQKIKFNIINVLRDEKYPNYADYISFMLLPYEMDRERKFERVIKFSQRLYPIDKYITIKKIVCESICNYINDEKSVPPYLVLFIREMSNSNKDNTWISLLNLIEGEIEETVNEEHVSILASYSKGEYEVVINKCQEHVLNNPRDLGILEIYARSMLFIENSEIKKVKDKVDNNIREVLLINLIRLYENSENYGDAISIMEDIDFRYRCFDFMSSICPTYYASYPFHANDKLKLSLIKLIASEFQLTKKNLMRYKYHNNDILRIESESFEMELLKDNLSYSRERRVEIVKELNVVPRRKDRIKELVNSILNYTDITLPDKFSIISLILIEIDEYDTLIELIKKHGSVNSSNLLLFPMKQLAEIIDNDVDLISNNVNASIFSFFYYQYYNKDFVDTTAFYLDRYLSDNNISRPSDRLEYGKDLDDDEIYILFYVCCEPILGALDNIDNALIMLTERLKIISSLSEKENSKYLSINNRGLLVQEEEVIYKRLLVSKIANHHASSLVNIDFKGLFNLKKSYYSITHEILKRLYDNELSVHIDYFMSAADASGSEDINLEDLLQNSSAKVHHYNVLYSNIIDDFIMNAEYGLVRYLSSEIRHGFLPNHIRVVFEIDGLVTFKVNDNLYEQPIHWLDSINNIDQDTAEYLTLTICDFSKKIDKLIDETNDFLKPVTLHETENPNNSASVKSSAFIFDVNADRSFELMNYIESCISKKSFSYDFTYDDFKDAIEEFLWDKLESCFERVRIVFNESVKPFFSAACDGLYAEISNNVAIVSECNILDRILSAKYNANEKISFLEGWFRKPIKDFREDFNVNINIILQASKEYIEGIYSPQEVNLSFKVDNCDDWALNNKNILNLTRSLVTMYNNCLKHGLHRSHTQITVVVNDYQGGKNIIVKNLISSEHEKFINDRNITGDVESFPDNKDDNKLINEGGTGLYKVYKNLTDGFKSSSFSVKVCDGEFYQIINFKDQ